MACPSVFGAGLDAREEGLAAGGGAAGERRITVAAGLVPGAGDLTGTENGECICC